MSGILGAVRGSKCADTVPSVRGQNIKKHSGPWKGGVVFGGIEMAEEYFGKEWEIERYPFIEFYREWPFCDPEHGYFAKLTNDELGTVFVSNAACNETKESDYYKIRSLVFEYNRKGTEPPLMLVAREEEEPCKSIWSDDKRAVLCIDDFLNRFPLGLSEKKQRALYLLYLKHKSYGDKIEGIRDYMLYAKNEQERKFILNSMIEQGLLRMESPKDISDGISPPFYIADAGWEALEVTSKIKTE
jgi:hypothetical protein